MKLSEIVPIAKVEVALGRPVDVERLQTGDVDEALRWNADHVFGISAAAWHRIVISGRFDVDARAMRRYLDHRDPQLARAIESLIGAPLFKELGYLKATVSPGGKPFVVATSCAVHLHSDELHVYDLGMADPGHPLSRHTRKSGTHTHRGFGLLADVMGNIFEAACERRCPLVTLTAANGLLAEVFSRHGFQVEENGLAQEALARGVAIPMEARVVRCPFCDIARGRAPAVTLYEDGEVVVFLDRAPIRPGHTQIIPRRHVTTFEELPAPLAARILGLGQQLAARMKAVYGVDRVAFLFAGSDVAHAHAHVFPIHEKADVTSARYAVSAEKLVLSSAHLEASREQLLAVRDALAFRPMP